jgi:hypothetical protein
MNARAAGILFLVYCLTDAFLIMRHFISTTAGAIIFAVGLTLFGLLSNGFRRKGKSGTENTST